MIIKTKALFKSSYNTVTDEIDKITEGILKQQTDDGEFVDMIPTDFEFSFYDVVQINRSSHNGYSTVCIKSFGSISIKMSFENAERLFNLCRG